MHNKRMLIVGILILLLVSVAALVFYYYRSFRDIPETPAQVIAHTINNFNLADPVSFLDIQTVIDLGPPAIEPLRQLAETDDHVTQWAVVTGLHGIRRTYPDQEQITALLEIMYASRFDSVRLLAAASNAGIGQSSGLSIVVDSLSRNDMMPFMDPPQSMAFFANRTLEFVSKTDMGFDEGLDEASRQAVIHKWQQWWSTHQQ